MKQLTSQEEYEQFIQAVVKHRNNRDPSSAKFVANSIIVSYAKVGDEIAPRTVATPYYKSTITPMSIINWSKTNYPEVLLEDIRKGAVKMLATDLENHPNWDQIQTAI